VVEAEAHTTQIKMVLRADQEAEDHIQVVLVDPHPHLVKVLQVVLEVVPMHLVQVVAEAVQELLEVLQL
jgi:cellobiose-specific phosphotransferase system component IIA